MSDFDWSETDINVLYKNDGDRDEAVFWRRQIQDLRRERSDVDPDDRNAMIETMKRWQRTREQIQRLRALAPSAA